MSQFNRPIAPKQSFPAPYYQPTMERGERERWEAPAAPPLFPPFGHLGSNWPSSSYPISTSYPYHPSSHSSREQHDYNRSSHNFSPINCSPEFHSVDRQSNNPYPSPTFSSPQLNGEQQLAGPSSAGPSRERQQHQQQQLSQYNEHRRSPAPRHEPYRRPEVRIQEQQQHQQLQRVERLPIKEGPTRPFVSKVAHLLRDHEKYGDAIRWDALGTTFILTLSSPVLFEMLTEMFSHRSLAAFSHQLNTYQFQRLTAAQLAHRFGMEPDPRLLKQYSAWTHPSFTRDNPETLNRLTPKPSRARSVQQKEKAMRILMGASNDYDDRYSQ